MKTILNILILLHGLIHLFGFLKAFEIAKMDALTLPVSKISGVLWLLCSVLFILAAALNFAGSNFWWVLAATALVLSQAIIVLYWKDARFGTFANLIILCAVIIAASASSFRQMVNEERLVIKQEAVATSEKITTESIAHLPAPVQLWLKRSGVVGRTPVKSVYLTQSLQMKMKPEQTDWYEARATQLFTSSPPAFNWMVNLRMNAFMNVLGRDQFHHGQGEMLIKLLSVYPMVDAENTDKLNQASLQRYLAEIVWFPSEATSSYIQWEPLDEHSARATMTVNGTSGSGDFHFDENGNFSEFSTMRYKDIDEKAGKLLWTIKATKHKSFDGITVPVELSAEWDLETGPWEWLRLNIEEITFDPE